MAFSCGPSEMMLGSHIGLVVQRCSRALKANMTFSRGSMMIAERWPGCWCESTSCNHDFKISIGLFRWYIWTVTVGAPFERQITFREGATHYRTSWYGSTVLCTITEWIIISVVINLPDQCKLFSFVSWKCCPWASVFWLVSDQIVRSS